MTETATETFRTALTEARVAFDRSTKRLSAITRETYELNDEIARLRRTITALAAMCSESPWTDALGITDSCIEVMEAETEEVSTQDVVKKLEGMGFDLASQKNPAASVHAVLSRLAEKKKIEKITNADNNAVTWRGPNYAPFDISDDDIPF
jgi:predicted ATPase